MGFEPVLPMYFHEWIQAPPSYPFRTATSTRLSCSPSHPPMFISPRITSGANPITIRKNCSTSLYIADVSPPRYTYTSTITAETSRLKLKFHPRRVSISMARAYMDIPEANMVIMAKENALKPLVFSSNRSFRYSGTDLAFEP
ncbi:hypothetical protein ES708_21346 [subsurface metagenome]